MRLWRGITWFEAIRIAWLLAWRGFVISIPLVFIVLFAWVLIAAFIVPFSPPKWFWEVLIPSILFWTIVNPMILSQLLRKRFQGFRLEIVRTEGGAPANALGPSGEGPRAPWPHSLR